MRYTGPRAVVEKPHQKNGFRYVQDRSAQNSVQGVCRQLQPCTSVQTNPTPGLTRTPTPNHNPNPNLWGAQGGQEQSRGSAACFGGVFPKNIQVAERPALTKKTRILHTVLCRPGLRMGRKPMKLLCIPLLYCFGRKFKDRFEVYVLVPDGPCISAPRWYLGVP